MKRQIRALIAASALMLVFVGAVPPPADAGPYSQDVFRWDLYERQVNDRTCVAASTAMMLNFIARRDLQLNQYSILRFAKPRDALDDSIQRGTDGLGWAKTATYYSPISGGGTTYRVESYTTARDALRRAASQIARLGKAVGLIVQHGKHAVVMTGFEATANPATSAFTLLRVWISDPYGYGHRAYDAAATPLDAYLELDATPYWDARWYRQYVIVVPQD